ncbi:MAG: extracellular solute-binding protein [Kamptonema sp. SIO4C4]|nr:extracellular solute-binding protein [Kamptonema sp. SIO4C4]
MVSRRSFLVGSGAVVCGSLLAGCSNAANAAFSVRLLNQSLPRQLINQFRSQLAKGKAVSFTPDSKIADIFQYLETWQEKATGDKSDEESRFRLPFIGQQTPTPASLVSLGDAWLETAIAQNLIQPLNLDTLEEWSSLPPRWQTLVKRNKKGFVDDSGQTWGAPYRWGTTMIVYNKQALKKLDWFPQDWDDLWDERLRDRISVIDQPREIIGLTLKKLGYSYNKGTLSDIPDLEQELKSLAQNIKFANSNTYLQPLLLKDTWVAVGWSSDILPILDNYPQLEALVPPAGTALWSDVWVQPAIANNTTPLLADWINFCWQEKSALTISLFTDGIAPRLVTPQRSTLPNDVQNQPLKFPAPDILDKSEFLYPIAPSTQTEYTQLWQTMFASGHNA